MSQSRKSGLTGSKLMKRDNLNWVECELCHRWELFENSGLGSDFDEKLVKDAKFECRLCKIEDEACKAEDIMCEKWKKTKDRLRKVEDLCDLMSDKVKKMEEKVGATNKMDKDSTGDVVTAGVDTAEDSTVGKFKRQVEEIESRVVVSEEKVEGRFVEVEKRLVEIGDRLMAFEVNTAEQWPKVGDAKKGDGNDNDGTDQGGAAWTTVSYKKASSRGRGKAGATGGTIVQADRKAAASAKIERNGPSFAELFKDKPKDTVVLLGDSIGRGVGMKLEGNSHMFTSVSSGGARIEDVTKQVELLKDNEDRHLVLLVGTNNINEGSEVILEKYKSLIDACGGVRNRKVSVVGVVRRYDVENFVDSRRFGVNERLRKKCLEKGVEYLSYEPERSRVARDGLHLNELGQHELAKNIFKHCVGFLLEV